MDNNGVFLYSQIVCALITMEAMKAENLIRQSKGESLAYDECSFDQLIERFGIGPNDALRTLYPSAYVR